MATASPIGSLAQLIAEIQQQSQQAADLHNSTVIPFYQQALADWQNNKAATIAINQMLAAQGKPPLPLPTPPADVFMWVVNNDEIVRQMTAYDATHPGDSSKYFIQIPYVQPTPPPPTPIPITLGAQVAPGLYKVAEPFDHSLPNGLHWTDPATGRAYVLTYSLIGPLMQQIS